MTASDGFDRTISDWLHADAEYRVPDHLDAVLRRTSTERQRPAWSSLERWLPMDTLLTRRGSSPGSLAWLAVLAALLLAVVGLALWAGAHQTAPPLGPASNGRILAAVDGALRSYAADGSDARTLSAIVQRGSAGDLAISPDGSRLAYRPASDPKRVDVLTFADGSIAKIQMPGDGTAVEPYSWSADGRLLVFVGTVDGKQDVYVAAADASSVQAVGKDAIASGILSSPALSPDGRWIAFSGQTIGGPEVPALYLIGVAGSGGQVVSQAPSIVAQLEAVPADGVHTWAPTGAARLAYVDFDGINTTIRVHQVGEASDRYVASGRWPTWSPDGTHLAYWDNGTVVVSLAGQVGTSDMVRPFSGIRGSCGREAVLDGNPVCGPVTWSPDGTQVMGYAAADHDLIMAAADGTGTPRRIDLKDSTEVRIGWQPIRP